MVYTVSAFYALEPFSDEQRQSWREELLTWNEPHLSGLVIFAPDGVNATVGADETTLVRVEDWFRRHLSRPPHFKHSYSGVRPFRRWKVYLRKETVTTSGRLGQSHPNTDSHVDAQQWNALLQDPEAVVIDVRNDYEISMGRFPHAIDPGTRSFSDFADFVERAQLPRDKKILTYCTGGIRCEKAVPYLRSLGYDQVYQLQGGILQYLERFPGKTGKFEGECFVFDDRVALDDQLQPSLTYMKCTRCGQPAQRSSQLCPDCLG